MEVDEQQELKKDDDKVGEKKEEKKESEEEKMETENPKQEKGNYTKALFLGFTYNLQTISSRKI